MRFQIAAATCGLLIVVSRLCGGDAAAGKTKSETCLGCHGIPATTMSIHLPRPETEWPARRLYRRRAQAYRDGQRTHGTMNVQAMSMSDQDMADIGAFWRGMGKVGERR